MVNQSKKLTPVMGDIDNNRAASRCACKERVNKAEGGKYWEDFEKNILNERNFEKGLALFISILEVLWERGVGVGGGSNKN